jgi:uncharacterized coiled-coil DUF342 family protein
VSRREENLTGTARKVAARRKSSHNIQAETSELAKTQEFLSQLAASKKEASRLQGRLETISGKLDKANEGLKAKKKAADTAQGGVNMFTSELEVQCVVSHIAFAVRHITRSNH